MARRLFLDKHALAEQPTGPARGPALRELIRRLGFVQLDSINTVARAHDMILFARRPRYRPADLKRLYEADRELFEHWTHDAAVIPMEFYPHWHLRFERDAGILKERWKNWRRDGFEERFQSVLRHVRDHGPVCAADLGKDEKKGSGGWWDWHPSKTALEYLWRSGVLSVCGRDGFQKRYDLTERIIEETLLAPSASPDPEETIDWCCRTALDRLGFATSGEIAAFWATVSPAEAKAWCSEQRDRGALIEVVVESADGNRRRAFAWPEVLEVAAAAPQPSGRIRVLSPFDPALRDRNRAQRLFGFNYRIEVFTPAARRKYGYYVFPLLERDRLVGRIDMRADRGGATLNVTAVWPEPGVRWSAASVQRLETELERVARFAGLESVSWASGWLRHPLTD